MLQYVSYCNIKTIWEGHAPHRDEPIDFADLSITELNN